MENGEPKPFSIQALRTHNNDTCPVIYTFGDIHAHGCSRCWLSSLMLLLLLSLSLLLLLLLPPVSLHKRTRDLPVLHLQ